MKEIYVITSSFMGEDCIDKIFEDKNMAVKYIREKEKKQLKQFTPEPTYYCIRVAKLIERKDKNDL